MDISDWAKPEVVQLLEQYIQEPAGSIEELQKLIQQIAGKNLTVSKLRHHLQQFQKETAVYKQHSKDVIFNENETSTNEIKQCDNSRGAAAENRVSVEVTQTDITNFEQGMAGEITTSKQEKISNSREHMDHVDNAEAVSIRTRTFRKKKRVSARRKQELRMLRSYRSRRRKKMKNESSITTIIDRKKNSKATDDERVKQEAEEQEMNSLVKAAGTTVPSTELTPLILSKPRVILRRTTLIRTRCIISATKPTIPVSDSAVVTSYSQQIPDWNVHENDDVTEPTIPDSNTAAVTSFSQGIFGWNVPGNHGNDAVTSFWQPLTYSSIGLESDPTGRAVTTSRSAIYYQ
ncbi:unnamed protein product [Onchocerca flexuosa]|uniref:DEK_C domain-containing protein n=1 Tax=Onchocerca flexuosa TaxID=387005 RepID=A0A183GZX3_9BILA|nr:unnamed protein product [Onchocerca flexuosa]